MKKTWRDGWRATVDDFCYRNRLLRLKNPEDVDWIVASFEARIQYACFVKMEQCGLSQRALATEVGIPHGPLSQFLSGNRTLRLPTAAKLCHYLGLEILPITSPNKTIS